MIIPYQKEWGVETWWLYWRGGRLQLGPPRVGSYPLKANLIGLMDLPKACPTCQARKTPALDPSPLSHIFQFCNSYSASYTKDSGDIIQKRDEERTRARIIADLFPLAQLNLSIVLCNTPPSAGACTTKFLRLPPQYQYCPAPEYIRYESSDTITNASTELERV